MKVLHLPTSIGGNSYGLSRAERSLGIDSEVLYLFNNYINYPADKIIFNDRSVIKNKFNYLYKLLKEFFSIRNKYDVFHFNYGISLFDFPKFNLFLLDLPFYPKNAKIFVTYNGCDARQKYPTIKRKSFSACHNSECYNGICNSGDLDEKRRIKIKIFEKYANSIFGLNPDLFHFLPKESIFLPYTIANWDKIEKIELSKSEKIRIVHSPTNRISKGSHIIINAIDRINKKYPDKIEFILVEGLSNDEALKVYNSADVIIDQILIGWYGGFAVEVMKMGKPVMVYICEEDLKFIHKDMARDCLETVININPDNIFDKFVEIIENRSILEVKGNLSIEYVMKWHNPQYIASITKSIYEM